MENNELLLQHKRLLTSLSSFPRRILSLHTVENVPAFILHGLCDKNCFDLHKAAYFVENPDFDFIKGIAGFHKDESYSNIDHIWNNPTDFSKFMKSSQFNNKVRLFNCNSIKRVNTSYEHLVDQISQEMGFSNPCHCTWDMKHDNLGLLVYEKNSIDNSQLFDEHFLNSLYLLSFCPVI